MSDNEYGNCFFSIVKGAGLALALSLLFAVLFACILQCTAISTTVVYPVNQTLKNISILIGSLLFVRGEKGWIKGGGIGLVASALSYLTFSVIGGDFSLSWFVLIELLLSFLTGALGGILAVNLKK